MAFKICYQYDITVRDDSDFVSVPMQLVNDIDNTPQDISAWTFSAAISERAGGAPYLTGVSGNPTTGNIIVSGDAQGQLVIRIAKSVAVAQIAAGRERGFWAVNADDGEDDTRIFEGTVTWGKGKVTA